MGATFPSGIVSFAVIDPNKDLGDPTQYHPTVHTQEEAEITAIETELGLNPKGSCSDVASRLDVLSNANGTPRINVRSTTSTTIEVTSSDVLIVCNNAIGSTVSLLAATGSGKVLTIKNVGVGIVTIDGNASDTIDGELTQTVSQYEAIQLVDYEADNWAII